MKTEKMASPESFCSAFLPSGPMQSREKCKKMMSNFVKNCEHKIVNNR